MFFALIWFKIDFYILKFNSYVFLFLLWSLFLPFLCVALMMRLLCQCNQPFFNLNFWFKLALKYWNIADVLSFVYILIFYLHIDLLFLTKLNRTYVLFWFFVYILNCCSIRTKSLRLDQILGGYPVSFLYHIVKLNKCLKVSFLYHNVKLNKCLKVSFLYHIVKLNKYLKGVFAKNERGYRLTEKNKRFWSLLILLLSVASVRRKLLKTTYTEERNVHTNWESCNIRLRS